MCKYCDEGEGIEYGGFETLYIDKKDEELIYEATDCDGDYSETQFSINYCPMCGKKLKG